MGGSRLILKNVAASKASDSSVVPGDGYSAVVTYLIFCKQILNLSSLYIVLCVILVFRKQFFKRFFLLTCLFFSLQKSRILKYFHS